MSGTIGARMSQPLSNVRIAFRVDASLTIGSGHVMRCLTLAHAWRALGAECHFLCRDHPGHLLDAVGRQGFSVHCLFRAEVAPARAGYPADTVPEHADWLGTSQANDVTATLDILSVLSPDWLVVDHYALDIGWEGPIRDTLPATRLVVIDDLADRVHQADILLDSSLEREASDYAGLVPDHCCLLIGPDYAPLRTEFARHRATSLARRRTHKGLLRLLITLGGVDKDNVSGRVLETLRQCPLPADLQITVVMGATAPWLKNVEEIAAGLPWSTEVVVNVTDMARRMSEADLAIGAAGSTAWERCCLGLPTLMLVLAENQQGIAHALHQAGAAHSLGEPEALTNLPSAWPALASPPALAQMSAIAARLVDGQGVDRLTRVLVSQCHQEIVSHE